MLTQKINRNIKNTIKATILKPLSGTDAEEKIAIVVIKFRSEAPILNHKTNLGFDTFCI